MIDTPGRSCPIPFSPATRRVPAGLDHFNLGDLRRAGRYWLDAAQNKLPRESLLPRLRQALEDDAGAGARWSCFLRWNAPWPPSIAATAARSMAK